MQAGPAEGLLMLNDEIRKVNGRSISMGMSRNEVVNLIRSAGKFVSISVMTRYKIYVG